MANIDLDRFVEGVRDVIARVCSPLDKRVSALAARVAEIETKTRDFGYRGTWERGVAYRAGNFVTDDGSLWACRRDTTARPGTSDDWQLAVKRGKDAHAA